MKSVVFGICMFIGPTLALASHAGGDQVQQSRPLIDQDTNEVVGIIVPVPACENIETVVDQSGKVLYVICVEE